MAGTRKSTKTHETHRSLLGRLTDIKLHRDGLLGQAMRYVIAGGIATCTDVATLFLLKGILNVHYLIAAACGFTVGTAVVYLLSIKWVFPHRSLKNQTAEISIFIAIGAVGLLLTEFVMYACVDKVGLHYMIAKFVAMVTVFTWDFGMRKALLFRQVPLQTDTQPE